jgi:hypothetical protein
LLGKKLKDDEIIDVLEYTVAGPSMSRGWLRVDSGSFKTHYEFKDGALYRITLSAESPG